MQKQTNDAREHFSPANHVRYLLHGIWQSDKKLMALMLLEMVCSVVTPFAALYLPKTGVELVTESANPESAARRSMRSAVSRSAAACRSGADTWKTSPPI